MANKEDVKKKSTSPVVTIPVIESTIRPNIRIVAGVMPAGILARTYDIPRRDTRKKTGYQREPNTSRVARLAVELEKGRVALPTALLLNLRDYQNIDLQRGFEGSLLKVGGKTLNVVDGQHRVLALAKLVEADGERWKDFPIPFVCMLGADERQEMEQFYVVNSTAKSVRTDLALDLLKQRADIDPTVMQALIESGKDWKVRAQGIAERMASHKLWKGRIRLPGDDKVETTISSSTIVSSLKPLLDTPYFGQIPQKDQLRILEAFWDGVRIVLPKPFDEPTAFVLQKSVGVIVLHHVLVNVLEYIRSTGGSVLEPPAFAKALKSALTNLEGDTREGEPVSGSDFWKTGPTGAAGAYSSNAGQRVLIARIRNLLPEIEVE